ncbi:hypothetical protein HK407_09g13860 [Ordospora pajunii]|uniref:uncharacterized protein n=1 Tax=Ordospora pajunii TaxID=3039483 RepID=UPI00295268C3|nr:uncharacterized protein HK407_09g13860 [Ordospora pajunii]KAH9410972.1 hypothetical protein HK407_09g13860 [Ordospora pajunii]
MIVGMFATDMQTKEVVCRMACRMAVSKIEHFILDFVSSGDMKGSVVAKGFYKYVYSVVDSVWYVVVVSMGYSEMKAYALLDILQKNGGKDMFDVLVAMDNILYGQVVFDTNLSLVKGMDSQEEKIHDMMMHNKRKEVMQKHKEFQRKPVSEIDRELERVRNLEIEMRNESIQQLKSMSKMSSDPVKERRKELVTSTDPVLIVLKEKLRMEIDKENNVKSREVQGDMTLMIKDEKYKDIEIVLRNHAKGMKFSPNIDKSVTVSGVIKCEKGFPVDKNVALVKWKSSDVEETPITFTFWPCETSLNVYQIMLEYTAEMSVENLRVFFPKARISNVVLNGDAREEEMHIEWEIGTVEKGGSDSLEFSCTCTDPSAVFPLDVYFTADFVSTKLSVDRVMMDGEEVDEIDVKKIFEVDKFVVVDE